MSVVGEPSDCHFPGVATVMLLSLYIVHAPLTFRSYTTRHWSAEGVLPTQLLE